MQHDTDEQGSSTVGITEEERQRRRVEVDRARHSIEMEGGRVSDEVQQLQEAYVRGEFDVDELVRRGLAVHGLQ